MLAKVQEHEDQLHRPAPNCDRITAEDTGTIGLPLCPGKKDRPIDWHPDLDIDLAAIREWGAEIVVTLMEPDEFSLLDVVLLPQTVARHGMKWVHLPIRDRWVPDAQFEKLWLNAGRIAGGGPAWGGILIHCRGGLGRTVMIAARLLVELGMDAESAIEAVRQARPGAIETGSRNCTFAAADRSWIRGKHE